MYFLSSARSDADYYWREFHGTIPEDAVPGGLDMDRKISYIGQAYSSGIGVYPGNIYPNQKHIYVQYGNDRKVHTYVLVSIFIIISKYI